MNNKSHPEPFSDELVAWTKSSLPKTIAGLNQVFAEKAIAITILVLMAIPALPLPTGGFSHVFEVIAMLLALELVIGLKSIWLPAKWRKHHLGKTMVHKVLPKLADYIRWLERYSRPRQQWILDGLIADRVIGLSIFGLCLAAFLAPPFSGLDTLPSMGVELIALSLILRDGVFLITGWLVGAFGVFVIVGLSKLIFDWIQSL